MRDEGSALVEDLRRAVLVAWLVITASGLLVLGAFHLLPADALLALAGRLQLAAHDRDPCVLCGMTRGLLALARGHVEQAIAWNRWSIVFYGVVLANAWFVLIRVAGTAAMFRGKKRRLSPSRGSYRAEREERSCRY